MDEGFDYENDISELKKQVRDLRTQVKYLKKIMAINIFGSKDEFREFFSDIW